MRQAFTLVELLVSMVIVAVLAALGVAATGKLKTAAYASKSSSNLRQLGIATSLYLGEHEQQLFQYRKSEKDAAGNTVGVTWWFGYETAASMSQAAGTRELDKTRAPLYPYLNQIGGVEICPGFLYDKAIWKPKYDGASCGYGYNVTIGGDWTGAPASRVISLSSASGVLLFATCAQVQGSSAAPRIEEFYGFDKREITIHFRFGGKALALFLDSHVMALPMADGTLDPRFPSAQVGRFTPVNSEAMLK